METLWFIVVAFMIAAYVVLDGFDLGAGVIYLTAAKTPAERQSIMRAIGPVWDGNEVWLIAAGGTLYFAFPLLYASAFSGFYLPLMMVLWLLMLRGIGIELRTHMDNPVWRGFFDFVFFLSSALLTIFFGAALGNVVRGVPLGPDQYFFEALWSNFRVGTNNGILDWYTVLTGLIALVTLTIHGALYIVTKTDGELNRRARKTALALWPFQVLLTFAGLVATISIRPGLLDNYKNHVIGFIVPALVYAALA
ncbi:MAG TPA: cytochrome d ubiquinol oxidase subunit II, partial [Candidatus Acidoferrum sp.]|nr:cytochrome d ubiquinol oxidase subunit II [Candidatus Acidoferrum sp.]